MPVDLNDQGRLVKAHSSRLELDSVKVKKKNDLSGKSKRALGSFNS